jgi:V-type H+-transporting ATPase subunit a
MKTSVIFGVLQMTLGTVIKGFNAAYFKRWLELIFVALTQICLLSALFGFMDIMIFIKWTTDWEEVEIGLNDKIKKELLGKMGKPDETGKVYD